MIKRRTILAVVLGALGWTVTLRADLMPASLPEVPGPPAPHVCLIGDRPGAYLSDASDPAIDAEVQALLARCPRDWESGAGQDGAEPPMRILSDRQSSLSLCLYSLIGLGLFRTAPLVKKLSWGGLPSWYHDGGPRQIGPSFAISPDCHCPAPVCFVQPEGLAVQKIPRYHFASVVSRWRKSQFTPAVLASRAPPSLS